MESLGNNYYLAPSPVVSFFLPISNITNAQHMVVTVTIYNRYIVGQLLHLSVPSSYGMIQANQLVAQITSINGLSFTTNIDSTQFNPFVTPSTFQVQPATATSYGSRNTLNYTTLPFHALNGRIGN